MGVTQLGPAGYLRLAAGEQSELRRADGDVASCGRVQLVEDRADVVVHGTDGDHEPVGDLAVGQALRQQPHDLQLAFREAGGVAAGGGDGAARDVGTPSLRSSVRSRWAGGSQRARASAGPGR